MFDHNTIFALILCILANPAGATEVTGSSKPAGDSGAGIASALPQPTADYEALPKYNGGDEFPVSRFGSAPSSAALEIRSHTYSAMENNDPSSAGRNLAGLQYDSNPQKNSGRSSDAPQAPVGELWRKPVQKAYTGKTANSQSRIVVDKVTESPSEEITPPAYSEFERVVDAEDAQTRGDELGAMKSTVQAAQGVQEVSLIATEMGFFPRTFFVNQEVPVRVFVTASSKKPLCMMIDAFEVRKQVKAMSVQEIFFTPKFPGKYRVYCPINGLEGVMVVREPARGAIDTGPSTSAQNQMRPRDLIRVPDQQSPLAHELDREISSRKFVPLDETSESSEGGSR